MKYLVKWIFRDGNKSRRAQGNPPVGKRLGRLECRVSSSELAKVVALKFSYLFRWRRVDVGPGQTRSSDFAQSLGAAYRVRYVDYALEPLEIADRPFLPWIFKRGGEILHS